MAQPAATGTPLDIVDRLMTLAKRAGADAADAVVIEGASLGASVRLGALEEIERSETRDLGLRVLMGQRQAFVSSTDWSRAALDELVERAVAMARIAPADRYCGLAPADLLATDIPDLDLEDSYEPTAEKLAEMAKEAEDAARAVKGVTNSHGAGAGWGRNRVVLATSHGFLGAYAATSHSVSCVAVAGEGTKMETDHESDSARFASDLRSPAEVGREAGERTVRRLNPRKVKTRAVPVVYEPRVAGSLLGHLTGAISGTAVARGTSFLKDRLGESVFARGIEVIDDPHRRRGHRSRPFDGEGVATSPRAVIADGVLTTWLLDSSSARQLGLATTGHAARGVGGPPNPAPSNFHLAPGKDTPEALIGAIEEGLFVTTLIGMGVNGVTGDYSRGAAGFWIEKGQIAYPVSEITIAGNLKAMFASLTPANDLEFRYGTNSPTVRIDGMTVAGN
jgi:PmbA protein